MSGPEKHLRSDGTGLVAQDPWLGPYEDKLRGRFDYYRSVRSKIDADGGLLGRISLGHRYFGFNRGELWGKKGIWYREWVPSPKVIQVRLIGDFNDWDNLGEPLVRDSYGIWSRFFPDDQFANKLVHESRVKLLVTLEDSTTFDRIPAYAKRVVQDPGSPNFSGQLWMPPRPFEFQNESPKTHVGGQGQAGLRVYEAHVGMAQEEGKVGSFNEFTDKILPRIKELDYNAIQLMAIHEHPYYGSFGYHVSNFFAPSSRFGTPDDLKRLIDTAHGMGIRVIMDIIHSHAVKNTREGLNMFDGTDYQYFHAGPRGKHIAWDSMLFDYSKYEVQRFLLSNVRYWLEDYRFDGFRFDGITSMLYLDHGLGKPFNSYDDYFGGNVDNDAVVYLQLANEVAHAVKKETITIAEDVSGMIGLARPVAEGGLGFDYRLAMGVPDYWIKILKEKKDEQWQLGELFHTLLNRRSGEKHIGYAESHDQALVGDKTIAFRLMDQEMYWHMDKQSQSLQVDRGIALHKIIRLLTFSLGGDGYLNFMGNEFGHPEWIDFPREGNNYSYHYARRQWSLADNPLLRYRGLLAFDQAMQLIDDEYHILTDPLIELLLLHEDNKQLIYRRGPLVFVVNFHPSNSYTDWQIPVPDPVDYKTVLNSDSTKFSGPGLVHDPERFPWLKESAGQRKQSIRIYVPSRSAQVLAPVAGATYRGVTEEI
ncbi:MAG TPA: alpha amylase C-terminal domain-containing protein [Tepidisphaeraceae bacterium]|nr:alpha amylase C-terminal domain-containing protein [Tepidisphaeraceae bacterium]